MQQRAGEVFGCSSSTVSQNVFRQILRCSGFMISLRSLECKTKNYAFGLPL